VDISVPDTAAPPDVLLLDYSTLSTVSPFEHGPGSLAGHR
jgi:hypothetical protein